MLRKTLRAAHRLRPLMMRLSTQPIYFENATGYVQARALAYTLVCYHAGHRQGTDLVVLLTHAGALLRAKGWHGVLSDQQRMTPFSLTEEAWVHAYWPSQQARCANQLPLAVVVAPPPT